MVTTVFEIEPLAIEMLLYMPYQLVSCDGTERPAQMTVACVVKHIGTLACAHTRQHRGHHGAQARPRLHSACAHPRETLVDPINQRADAVGADVMVYTVELRRARHAKAV